MEKIKVKSSDIFGHLHGVSINSVDLTPSNILNYDLYRIPTKSNDMEDVYKIDKGDRGFYIIHYKDEGFVDWCETLD